MTGTNHVETILAMYAAFGRGDLPAVLENLADDVRWDHWEDNHAQRQGVEHLKARTGPEQVAEFFGLVAGFGVSDFQVLDVMASERQVAVEVRIQSDFVTDEELHLWTFGEDGKVTRVRHYVDTAKHIEAAKALTA